MRILRGQLLLRSALAILIFVFPRLASAACSSPTANVGSLDFQSSVFKYCDGTTWQNVGGIPTFPLKGPNGTATGPTFSFSAGTNTGMFSTGPGTLSFATAGTTAMTITNAGYVGIGTTAPIGTFEVTSNASSTNLIVSNKTGVPSNPASYVILKNYRSTWGLGDPAFISFNSRGTEASPSSPTTGMTLMSLEGHGYGDASAPGWSDDRPGAIISMVAEGNWGNSNVPTYIQFSTAPSGTWSTSERMRIAGNGYVGIGTSSPAGILDVRGGTATAGNGTSIGIYAQAGQASGNTNGGNIYLIPGAGNGTGFTGAVGINSTSNLSGLALRVGGRSRFDTTIGLEGWDSTTYSSNLYSTWGTSTPMLEISNDMTQDGDMATVRLIPRNTAATYQAAVITAISTTSGTTPIIAIGAQTGSSGVAERMRIDTAGNVGIGTTNPTSLLHIYSNTNSGMGITVQDPNSTASPSIWAQSNGGGGGIYNTGTGGTASWGNRTTLEDDGGGLNIWAGSSTADIRFFVNGWSGSAERMRIMANGNVGIGTNNPGYTLHVVGNAGLSTGTAWTNASDVRLKHIDGDYEYGLDEILKLHTVRFHYKEGNALGLPTTHPMTGFIAQEVQNVIPDAVSVGAKGYLQLNVDPIHWAAVNAIQQLHGMCKATDDKVEAHDREIASLKSANLELQEKTRSLEQENAAIKSYLCAKDPSAPFCR